MEEESPLKAVIPLTDGSYFLYSTRNEHGEWHSYVQVKNNLAVGFGSTQNLERNDIVVLDSPPAELKQLASHLMTLEKP